MQLLQSLKGLQSMHAYYGRHSMPEGKLASLLTASTAASAAVKV
jgi:hypothetical protein